MLLVPEEMAATEVQALEHSMEVPVQLVVQVVPVVCVHSADLLEISYQHSVLSRASHHQR
jgi:hypothetical protein